MRTPANQWGSDSENEAHPHLFSHEEYTLSRIGVFSAENEP